MIRIILIMITVVIYSCKNNDQNLQVANSNLEKSDTVVKVDAVKNIDYDSTVHIKFPAGASSVTVCGKMKGIAHPITVYIPITIGKELTALLVPQDSLANIRFNQIFTPDGKADGPFGRELKRTITEQGTYKLIIGENQMQGDEWKGNFELTIGVIK